MNEVFKSYKYTNEEIAELRISKQESLKLNAGFSNLLGFAVRVIGEMLKQHPLRYRQYGPYWWGLKKVLNENGYNFGDSCDVLVMSEYSYEDPEMMIVAADKFRNYFLKTFFHMNNEFILNIYDPLTYVLFDEKMEGING